MNIWKKSILSLMTLLAVSFGVCAQNVGSDSPYGRYGYGSLSNPAIGAAESMGGIGYGLRRSQQVNPANPASYSRLDSLTFIFDMGLSAQMARFSDATNSSDYKNGNLDYLAMQFPIVRKVGASIGLLPYSKVGYNYGKRYSREDVYYYETFRGSGGLSRVYGGISYAPFENVSVGVNVSYLFGDFSYSRTVTPASTSGTAAYISQKKNEYAISTLMQEWGVQYSIPITRERSLTLGAVYTPKVSTKTTIYPMEAMYQNDPYDHPYYSPVEIIPTDTLGEQTFQMPESFGLGFTYAARKFLIGLDGTYQRWKNLEYPPSLDGMDAANRFNNVVRINAGAEYAIEPLSRNYLNRVRFRGGLSYANSYANVSAADPSSADNYVTGGYKEYGVNLGLGFPIRSNLTGHVSMINVGFNYSLRQPDKKFMIKEETYKVFVNVNINEFWFFKRRFD